MTSIRAVVFLSLLPMLFVGLRNDAVIGIQQDYPTRRVRIVESFGIGGGPDLLARALAPQLSEIWGQPVTVENITGKGATAGPASVAHSPADGYTLLINTNAQAYSAAVTNDLSYDPLKDFIPIAPLTSQPYVLVASKLAGLTSVKELIEAAKAKPDQLKFGSTGIGTSTHIGVEKFNQAAGIRAVHVPPLPTDSNANMIANVIAGSITYCLSPIALVMPALKEGKVVALGVTTIHRSSLLPAVPTIAEGGVARFDFPIWYGLWVRAGTPNRVVKKLLSDITNVLTGRTMRDWMAQHGGEPMNMTQAKFARFVRSESESARQIIKAAAVKAKG